MNRFIIKQVSRKKSQRLPVVSENKEQIIENKNIEVMDTKEKIEMAQSILMDEPKMKVKKIKKDNLIFDSFKKRLFFWFCLIFPHLAFSINKFQQCVPLYL